MLVVEPEYMRVRVATWLMLEGGRLKYGPLGVGYRQPGKVAAVLVLLLVSAV